MSVQVTGADELKYLLRQAGERAVKGAFDQMRKEAKRIESLAKQMAPVDEGDLEDAIQMVETGGGRDNLGRFSRKSITIEVDMNASAGVDSQGRPRTVGAYAYTMHEHLTPYGEFRLGKKSRAKQASQSVMVGGKYLERAMEEVMPGLIERVVKHVREELAGD